ncbi:MAG TPA: pilus assembly protein [Pseudolabrys sp.]|nr:pilus assembly protein [Pseudolabrys sp.]
MCVTSALIGLRQTLRAFRSDRRGNIATIFALALLPVIGFVGASVDYTRASNVKTAMQAALDSTALMLAKANPGSMTQSALNSSATAYFNALFARPEASNIAINAAYQSTGGTQITVTGSASMKTNFMAVFGYNAISINGSSTVVYGSSRLRVALVLDNTGSMNDYGKLDALKTATTNLLTQLKNAATTNGDVYVSIIPFNKDVNVGSANYNATWIDWSLYDTSNSGWGGGWGGWGGGGGGSFCFGGWCWNGSSWTQSGSGSSSTHSSWNGCVTDRGGTNAPDSGNYDTNVVAPTSTIQATQYTAEQYSYCLTAQAMGLSYDWTSMNSLVSSMVANGNTNQAIGLQLGWMSLAGGGPFTAPAMDPNYTYQQIIILLTDGLNTQDRWYSDQSSIDARQTLTCNNIKAAGITLYTIQVNTDGDPTSTLLQNCASSSSKFFLLTSSNQIVTTFNTIGTNLSKLRVAK